MSTFDILDKCRTAAKPEASTPPESAPAAASQEPSPAICEAYQTELKLSYCLTTDSFRTQYGAPARVDKLIMSECKKRWPTLMSEKENSSKLPAKGSVHFLRWHHDVSTKNFTRGKASDHHYEHDESNLAIFNYLQEHQAQHLFVEGITKEYRHADLAELMEKDRFEGHRLTVKTVQDIFAPQTKKVPDEARENIVKFQKLLLEEHGIAAIYLILHPDAVIHPVDTDAALDKTNLLAEKYFQNAQDQTGQQLVFADTARRELEVEKRVVNFLTEHPEENAFIIYGSAHDFADNFNHYPQVRYQEANADTKTDPNVPPLALQTLASALNVWQGELGKKIHHGKPIWERSEQAYLLARVQELFPPIPQNAKLETPEGRYWQAIQYRMDESLQKSYASFTATQQNKSRGYFDLNIQIASPFGKIHKINIETDEKDPQSLSHKDAQGIFNTTYQEIRNHRNERPWEWSGDESFSLKCRFFFTTDPDEARELRAKNQDNPFVKIIYID